MYALDYSFDSMQQDALERMREFLISVPGKRGTVSGKRVTQLLVDLVSGKRGTTASGKLPGMNHANSMVDISSDVNHQFKDLEGATQLWKAAELGHHLAVEEILQHPNIDPNKTHKELGSTPLFIAACFGHERVVKALLSHPSIRVNCGKGETTPLFMAAQEGREGVVKMLLNCKDIDIAKASTEGITPARVAAEFGHEHIHDLFSGR
jgi:hypothetical protein